MPTVTTTDAFVLSCPDRQVAPVILSSPHSGNWYPPDFLARSVLDRHAIRSSEDAFVDRLFGAAPDLGLPLLAARVPRAYLDLNRAPDEMDPAVIDGIEQPAHNPRVSSGLGVIPRVVAGARAIYAGKLSRQEADFRLTRYWHPYHDALRGLIGQTVAAFGEAIVLDCHSMPHEAIEGHARFGAPLPEVVLGDRYGAAAGREVMARVEAAFQAEGLRVARNAPFAGAHITHAYGRPSQRVHVIQVEIDRALYMDEARIEPLARFDSFRARIGRILVRIAGDEARGLPLAAE